MAREEKEVLYGCCYIAGAAN